MDYLQPLLHFSCERKKHVSLLQSVMTETYSSTEKCADGMENRVVQAPAVFYENVNTPGSKQQ